MKKPLLGGVSTLKKRGPLELVVMTAGVVVTWVNGD